MSLHVIHSARLVSGGEETVDAWVAFENDIVSALGTGDDWRASGRGAVSVIDARGRLLTPGLIDMHCHGGGGSSFDGGGESIENALSLHHRHGSTRILLSLVTAGQSHLERTLSEVAGVAERNPLVLGAHLEGPFLADSFRGAHDPTLLRAPDVESIERLLEAGRGQIRQVTLAPELPGADSGMRRLLDAGVAVAVGHTGADYDTALKAFDNGASILTHAFNGMRGIHHRMPGPVAAATRSSHVTLEVINDGVHVHPEIVRLAFSAAPGRIALVTDAMAAAGASDGRYRLGTLDVTVTDRVARADRGGSIAGSTLTLDHALRQAVNEAGIALVDAVSALTTTPARAIGYGHKLGLLAPGYAADAVLFGEDFHVEVVFAAGRRLPT